MIVTARKEDLLTVAALLAMLHEEAQLDLPPIDPDKLYAVLVEALEAERVFLAVEDDEAVGCCVLQESTYYFSNDRMLTDRGFYVRPAWRSKGVPGKLLQSLKEYSKMKGLPLYISLMTGKDALAKARWFQMMGAPCVGGMFKIGG